MKIAVTYENGTIFQHFGHTKEFKVYEVEDKKIISSSVVPVTGGGHGAVSHFLKDLEVDTVICGGIGGCAQDGLKKFGIAFYGGASGDADEAVAALLEDKLDYDPNAKCNHHGEHGSHGHSCNH